ncbi:MAG: M20 family metallopeptidase [Candidatus Hermodarchaeota archaeon]
MHDIEKVVLQKIDDMREDIIKFQQQLIQHFSEVPPGKYREISKFTADKMKEIGLDTKIKRNNVVGEWGNGNGTTLILNAHLDTVPCYDGWTKNPYGGEIIDNKIYGRGSSDDKACVTAEIFAIKALIDAGIQLNGKVIVTAVVNEEIGGLGGAEYIVNEGIVRGDACLLGDSSVEYPVAYRGGVLQVSFIIKGVRRHAMFYPDLPPPNRNKYFGINAIEKMLKIMNFLKVMQEELYKIETKYSVPPDLPAKISSVNFTQIEGGTSTTTVPDKCVLHCLINVIPEIDLEEIKTKILDFIEEMKKNDPLLDIIVQIPIFTEPTKTDIDTKFAKAVKQAYKSIFNEEREFKLLIGTTDAHHFQRKSIETILIGPFRGDNNIHAQDEFVYIEDIITTAKLYALTALHYLK